LPKLNNNKQWTAEFGMEGADPDDAGDQNPMTDIDPQQSAEDQSIRLLSNALATESLQGGGTMRQFLMPGSGAGVGITAFLQQHDTTMREQLQLQKEIVLRLKQQQHDLGAWQERLERWEIDLSKRDSVRGRRDGGDGDHDDCAAPAMVKTTAGRERTASIVRSMDQHHSGCVTWEQFLAYIRWQERHFGMVLPAAEGTDHVSRESDLLLSSPTRRASTVQRNKKTMYQVRTRIDLRKVFDSLCPEATMDGSVSCDELIYAIRFSQRARELFLPSLLAKTLPKYSVGKDAFGLTTPDGGGAAGPKYWL
jgi:hypothetical protein